MVTAEQCKQVVRETGMKWLGHHRCSLCGQMVGYQFVHSLDCSAQWQERLGLDGPNDTVALFNAGCGCSDNIDGEPRSWAAFAEMFNMQSTEEARTAMWERFKAGKPTHEAG